jgi:hypothetical protein
MKDSQRPAESHRTAEDLGGYVVPVNERVNPDVFAGAVRAVIAMNRRALESLKDK